MIIYLLGALNLFGFVLDLVVIKAFSDVVGWVFCASLAIFVVFSSKREVPKLQNPKLVFSMLVYSLGFIFTESETLGSLLILFTCILIIRINMHKN